MVDEVLRDMHSGSSDDDQVMDGVTVQDFVAYTKRSPVVADVFSQKAKSIVAFACANRDGYVEVG